MATIHEMSDHTPKHRRAPSSLPPLNFPGSDPLSDPYPAFLSDPDRAARFTQILGGELASRGLPPLAADLPAEDKRTILSWPRRNPMAALP